MTESGFLDAAALVSLSARLALCVVFLAAALHGLRDRDGFSATVQAYRLLPERLAGIFALILPPLELAAAAALVLPGGAAIGGTLGLGLMASFTVAIAINLRRGRADISCGCGGGDSQTLSWALVARNLVLLGLLAFCLAAGAAHRVSPALYVGAAGFAIFLTLLYFAVNQLLINAQALRPAGRPA